MAAKVQNSRQLLLRAARETPATRRDAPRSPKQADVQAGILARLRGPIELDDVRGAEGEAARAYFGVLRLHVRADLGALGPRGTHPPPAA